MDLLHFLFPFLELKFSWITRRKATC